jgi:hypothetical protein
LTYSWLLIIIAKFLDDGRPFFFWPIKISIYPRPRRCQWCRASVECILVFGYRMCVRLVLYIIVCTYLLRRCWRCYRCRGMGDGRGRRGVWWWQRRSRKRDENIIIANVIFATRRTPFVRKLAKKYIFFTATRHPQSSKDDGEEGVKIIAGC